MKLTIDEASKISREIRLRGDSAESALAAKCRNEAMTRLAVIIEWGDPRKWSV